jgi:hypothetical protein
MFTKGDATFSLPVNLRIAVAVARLSPIMKLENVNTLRAFTVPYRRHELSYTSSERPSAKTMTE